MTFPTTAILDNFNRANEGPPPSANWYTPNYLGNFWGMKVISNHCEVASIPDDTGAGSWTTQIGPDCEAYCDYIAGTINYSNVQIGIRFDIADLWMGATGNEGTGYIATCQPGNPATIGSTFILTRTDGVGGSVILGQDTTTIVAIGDSFGISAIGTTIKVYHKPAAGSWTEVISVVDATYNRSGYIGVQLVYAVDKIDNFGGGTIGPAAPVADFSGTPTSGTAGLSVDFTDLSTNTPTSWLWDFGDGNTSTDQNPTNVYASPGTYTVELTATNGVGSDTETKVDYITILSAPVADFSGTPTSGNVPLSVDFTDLSTNSPTSWFWDFGDGGSSTSQNPTYVYNYIGVYTVTLTATSSSGSDSETKVAYITVNAVPEVGAAEVEDCDTNTGGLAVGLRVSNVALARDNWLGSLTIDASAELRAKDNSYSTLVNNGTLTSLVGDKSVWDTDNFAAGHAKDIDDATGQYHLVSAATQAYTISNPSTDRAYDVTATTLNELAAIVGTLIADLKAKGLLS